MKSMTGYGRARQTLNGRDITVEVRSVNNRYLDCSVKTPRAFLFAEDALKALIQKHVSRGKVDMYLSVDAKGADETVITVNTPLVERYLAALQTLHDLGGGRWVKDGCYATDLARLPDVLTVTKAEEDLDALGADLCAVAAQALAAHTAMREVEGRKLEEDIFSRLDTIEAITAKVEARSPQTVAEYREKLLTRMRDVLQSNNVDESRLLLEAAIFADKVAVDEETVRLRSHLGQFREMLRSGEPIGRKLDFLIQEINREANTVGSKCTDIQIARDVVDLKAELEKIREQVQNIE